MLHVRYYSDELKFLIPFKIYMYIYKQVVELARPEILLGRRAYGAKKLTGYAKATPTYPLFMPHWGVDVRAFSLREARGTVTPKRNADDDSDLSDDLDFGDDNPDCDGTPTVGFYLEREGISNFDPNERMTILHPISFHPISFYFISCYFVTSYPV